MSKRIVIWFFTFLALPLLVTYLWSSYNKMVKREEKVKKAWAEVENQYQRRADLIPNLVETAKGYAAHEQSTFEQVIEARSKATQVNLKADDLTNTEAIRQFEQVQGEVTQGLSRLMAVVEAYPDLKANDNYIMLQGQLEGTENRILLKRSEFNERVNEYNAYIRRFPKNVVAGIFGFKKINYFETHKGDDKAPKI